MNDMQILHLKDLFWGPFYFIIIILAGNWYKRKYLSTSPVRVFFSLALVMWLLASVAYALIAQYVYTYGDTFGYHKGAQYLNDVFFQDPASFFELYFKGSGRLSENAETINNNLLAISGSESVTLTMKVIGVVSLITDNSYIADGLILALLAFWGSFKILRVFSKLYPAITKQLVYAVLFLPSAFFWGSGVIKEPICIFSLGLLISGVYTLAIGFSFKLNATMQVVAGVLLLLIIKSYILYSFMIAAFIWVLGTSLKKIREPALKYGILGILIFFIILFFTFSNSGIDRVSNIPLTAEMLTEKISSDKASQDKATELNEGSGFETPPISFGGIGFVRLFFFGVNVTYFRPYLWEIKKLITIPSALESLFNVLFTLFVIVKTGLPRFLKYFFTNPDVLFVFAYCFSMGMIVGVSSFNFGTLVRYKAPCASFLLIGLLIIYHEGYLKRKVTAGNAFMQ